MDQIICGEIFKATHLYYSHSLTYYIINFYQLINPSFVVINEYVNFVENGKKVGIYHQIFGTTEGAETIRFGCRFDCFVCGTNALHCFIILYLMRYRKMVKL